MPIESDLDLGTVLVASFDINLLRLMAQVPNSCRCAATPASTCYRHYYRLRLLFLLLLLLLLRRWQRAVTIGSQVAATVVEVTRTATIK